MSVTNDYDEIKEMTKNNYDSRSAYDMSFESVSNAAKGIPDLDKVSIEYAAFAKRKEERKEKRLDDLKRRNTLKKAIAVISVVAIGGAGLAYVDHQMSDKDKIDKPSYSTEQEVDSSVYDAYVDYVQETNGTLSQEGYKAFAEDYNESSSRGAR